MDYTLEYVSPYEFLGLTKRIRRREANDRLMELLIVTNPHVKNPDDLRKQLFAETQRFEDRPIETNEPDPDWKDKLGAIFQRKV